MAIYYRRKARTPFLSFICMSVPHFSSGGARSSVRWTSRYVGVLIGAFYPFLALAPPLSNALPPGHHYVPTVIANTRLDGRRNRDAPQPSVRAQFDLAQRAEPLYGKVKSIENVLPFQAAHTLPTFCAYFVVGRSSRAKVTPHTNRGLHQQ